MKMGELVKAGKVFRKIMTQEIGIRTAYDLAKMAKKMDLHLDFFDEKRIRILNKYYESTNGNLVPKSQEDLEKAQSEMEELLELDVEFEDFEKVVIPETEKIIVSACDMVVLESFVKFKEE